MAVKRRKQKKRFRETLYKQAVKIRCCFCDIKDTCSRRVPKEKLEDQEIMTYCMITPNKPSNKKRKRKRRK